MVQLARQCILLAKGLDLNRRRVVRRILEDFALGHENVARQKSHVTCRQCRILCSLLLEVALQLAHVRQNQTALHLSLERSLGNLQLRVLGRHSGFFRVGVNLRRKLTQKTSVLA